MPEAKTKTRRALPAAGAAQRLRESGAKPGARVVITPAMRKIVESAVIQGLPQDLIAKLVGMGKAALQRHFRDEIDFGLQRATGSVVANLFNLTKTSPVACFYWLGNRDPENWKNVNRIEGNITVRNEMPDLSACSRAELAVLRQAAAIVEKAQARKQIEGEAKDVTPEDDET